MLESGLTTDVDSDYQVGMPEVQVIPDRNKAADLGISMAEIGETINSAVGGQRIGKFKDKGRRFDIRVRLLAQQRQRPEDIGRLLVRAGGGGLVRLGDIVRIEQRPTLQAITRRDRERAITIRANVAPGVSQAVAIDRSVEIARETLPENYRAVPSGTARTFRESFDSLLFAMGLGLVVAYMVLASQFNAFTHPFTVLLALPFSVSGALLALWIAGQSLNVYSMLGLILLMALLGVLAQLRSCSMASAPTGEGQQLDRRAGDGECRPPLAWRHESCEQLASRDLILVIQALVLLLGATTEHARDAAELSIGGERHHESIAALVEFGQAVLQQRKSRRSV